MRRRFIENLAFFVTLNMLIKPLYVFGIDRVVQNTVGTNVYGSYFPLFNLVLIFQIFLDMGIENFTRKEVGEDETKTRSLLSKFLVIKLILSAIFLVTFSGIGYLIPHDHSEWKLLSLLILNQTIASLILFLRANMGGLHLFKAESITSVLDRLVMILICGTLLIVPFTKQTFKIEWFVLSQTVAYLITLAFSLIVVLRKTGKIQLKFNFRSYIPVLKQLKLYATLVLLMAFYYRIDSIFLRYMLPNGREQAGIYAQAFRILDFLSNYALIFAFILLPTFAQQIKKKESIASLLRLSALSLLVPSTALLIGIAFYREQIFSLLYTNYSIESANTFLILTISFIGICFSYTFGALLTANGNLKDLNRMALTAMIISSILNILLIPRYQVIGAAISNACSQLFTIGFHTIIVTKRFNLKVDYSLLFRGVLFLITSVIWGVGIQKIGLSWIPGVVAIAAGSFGFAILFRLLKVKYAIEFIRESIRGKDLSTSK